MCRIVCVRSRLATVVDRARARTFEEFFPIVPSFDIFVELKASLGFQCGIVCLFIFIKNGVNDVQLCAAKENGF
jgi:hypothetical protein